MSGRDIVLGRIREALRVAAPPPHAHSGISDTAGDSSHHAQDWLPPVGPSHEDQVELFRKNAEALKATFIPCSDDADAARRLAELAADEGWKKIAAHSDPLVEACLQDTKIPALRTDGGYDKMELETCDAGITTCECLVAQTGSILVSSSTSGGRALSVLPPHHVVLARGAQLLPDLTAALEGASAKYSGHFPSALSFITGPSRTGDIERILVLGAHGPKKLTIFLIG